MNHDPLSAAGARLDALLQAQEARTRTAKASAKLHSDATTPFVLPESSAQSAIEAAPAAANEAAASKAATVPAELGVGATFRRAGVLSDVPMRVSRVADGMVFTTFGEGASAREMAFAANTVDIVTKAPTSEAWPQMLIEQHASVLMAPPAAPELPSTAAAIPAEMPAANIAAASQMANSATAIPAPSHDASTNNVASAFPAAAPTNAATSAATAASASAASTMAATASAPPATAAAASADAPNYKILPDGTRQYGYAPSGGWVNPGGATSPPVPAAFGVGATFRRKGVLDNPMTVSRIGNGVIFATFTDSEGTREVPFMPDQLDLVTPAPG